MQAYEKTLEQGNIITSPSVNQNSLQWVFGDGWQELDSRVIVKGFNSVIVALMEDLNWILYEPNKHEMIIEVIYDKRNQNEST